MKVISQISNLMAVVTPSYKDEFVVETKFDLILPADFPSGNEHSVLIECINCNRIIHLNLLKREGFDRLFRANIHSLEKESLLMSICEIFDLNPDSEKRADGKYLFFNLSFKGKYKSIADIGAYHCESCNAKYMMSFACYEGENEKKPEPDIIYIEKILHVESLDEIIR